MLTTNLDAHEKLSFEKSKTLKYTPNWKNKQVLTAGASEFFLHIS